MCSLTASRELLGFPNFAECAHSTDLTKLSIRGTVDEQGGVQRMFAAQAQRGAEGYAELEEAYRSSSVGLRKTN